MTSERDVVAAALDDCVRMGAWRILGRRARLQRLYHQLRADGVGWRRARQVRHRTAKAVPMVRKEPKAREAAIGLILS